MSMETNKIYKGTCLEVIKTFPDKSIDCVITSPPYWQLRDYGFSEQWGLDYAKEAIDDMKLRYPHVFWQVGDVYNTKFPNNYFDYAIAGELIEHLEKPEKFIKSL